MYGVTDKPTRKVIETGSSLGFKEFRLGRGQFHDKIRNHEPQSVQLLRIRHKPVPCALLLSPPDSASDHTSLAHVAISTGACTPAARTGAQLFSFYLLYFGEMQNSVDVDVRTHHGQCSDTLLIPYFI